MTVATRITDTQKNMSLQDIYQVAHASTALCIVFIVNPCSFLLFIHLKLELLTQIPASNEEKYLYL